MKQEMTGQFFVPLDGHTQLASILSVASAGKELKLSVPTVTASLKHQAKLGIARETTDRIYAYDKYLKILNEGTEPNGA